MKLKNFSWGAASFIVVFLCAIPVGYRVISSCKNQDFQMEYASETSKKFYQKMIKMEKNSILVFNGFPTCLTDMLSHAITPGDQILCTEKDTLYLVLRGLNYRDINKYPYYIIKDNHNNLWSLFRHNGNFILTREDEVNNKALLNLEEQNEPKE